VAKAQLIGWLHERGDCVEWRQPADSLRRTTAFPLNQLAGFVALSFGNRNRQNAAESPLYLRSTLARPYICSLNKDAQAFCSFFPHRNIPPSFVRGCVESLRRRRSCLGRIFAYLNPQRPPNLNATIGRHDHASESKCCKSFKPRRFISVTSESPNISVSQARHHVRGGIEPP
jgi:hypothetical protein